MEGTVVLPQVPLGLLTGTTAKQGQVVLAGRVGFILREETAYLEKMEENYSITSAIPFSILKSVSFKAGNSKSLPEEMKHQQLALNTSQGAPNRNEVRWIRVPRPSQLSITYKTQTRP